MSIPELSLLESLPLHLFEEVCEHLAADNLDKHTLPALSLTCQRLYSATARLQYRTVRIEFLNEHELRRGVERWKNVLQARDCTRYVRRLNIVEKQDKEDEFAATWPRNVWPLEEPDNIFPHVDHAWPLDSDDEFWTCAEAMPHIHYTPDPAGGESVSKRGAWLLLAQLIPSLTGLRDVVYQCRRQIPTCLLTALHEHSGRVRLHMHSFNLRSLHQTRGWLHDIDSHEYQLATSPCLASIRTLLPIHGLVREEGVCYNEDAIWKMVGGLAPNLKSVSIDWLLMSEEVDEYEESDDEWERPKPEWPGFFSERPSDTGSRGKGALETLALGAYAPLNPELVSKWTRYTDFNVLRSLLVRSTRVDAAVLESLSDIAEAHGFRSLRCLALWTGDWPLRENQRQIDLEMARLLRALHPLDSLDLHGIFADETFEAVLRCHGKSLGSLRLVPLSNYVTSPSPFVLTRGHVEALVLACPDIEDLELLVLRRKGNQEETWTYRALAGLRQLDRLSLLLDCTDEFPDRRYDEEDVDRVAPKYLRDAFINFAIDDMLAADILEAICQHRSPRYIRLNPIRIGCIGRLMHWDIVNMGKCLSKAWIRVRDVRAGREEEFYVTEVEARDKDAHEPELGRYLRWLISTPGLRDVRPISEDDTTMVRSYRLWKGD